MLNKISGKIVVIGMLIFLGYYSIFAYKHYALFLTAGHDDAIYVQSMWTALNGRLFWNTLDASGDGISHLGVHSSVILFLLLPFFKLFQNAFALNFLQILILALGAIPIYLLAAKLMDRFSGVILATCYLLSPFVAFNIYDTFHPSGFIVPLFLFSYYFYINKKKALYFIFLLLVIFCREDVALSVFFFGLYLLFFKRDKFPGLITAFLGIGWFLFSIKYFQPRLRIAEPLAMIGSPLGNNIKEIITNFVSKPSSFIENSISLSKFRFIIKILLPFGFLPLFEPPLWLPVFPLILQNIILMPKTEGDISLIQARYYDFALPFLFIATVHVLTRCKAKIARCKAHHYLSIFILFTIVLSYKLYGPMGIMDEIFSRFYNSDEVYRHARAIRETVKIIPEEASVSSDGKVLPILARRNRLYWYPTHVDESEYVIIDNKWPVYVCGTPRKEYHAIKKALVKKHGILKQLDGLYLIKLK